MTKYSLRCLVKSNFLSGIFFLSLFIGLSLLQAVNVCAQQTPGNAPSVHPEFFSRGDCLYRVLEQGDTLTFSAQLYGGISSFDALNPFKILIFSQAFQKVYYLDHRLAPLSESCSLQSMGFGEVRCACASRYGGFWVYDRWQQRLVRVNEQGQIVAVSETFPSLDLDGVVPEHIREKGDWLYVLDPNSGGYLFDLFGAYITSNPQLKISD